MSVRASFRRQLQLLVKFPKYIDCENVMNIKLQLLPLAMCCHRPRRRGTRLTW